MSIQILLIVTLLYLISITIFNSHIQPSIIKFFLYSKSCQSGICEHICTFDNPAPPIQSARIKTNGTFGFKYGHVEIRAKLPKGEWLWPALWLMPSHSVYGNWPRSGEIDLMESRSNPYLMNGDMNVGVRQIASTLHYGTESNNSAWRTSHYVKNDQFGWNEDFHSYQVKWAPGMYGL